MTKPWTVLVEGSVGAGKSRFLELFRGMKGVEVIPEPVHIWTNYHGANLLGNAIKDPKEFPLLQLCAYLTQLKSHLIVKEDKPVKIMERSLLSARYCFVELVKQAKTNEVACKLFEEWYDLLVKEIGLHYDSIIYLRTSPIVAYARTQGRGRREEESLRLDYFEKLNDVHEKWLMAPETANPLITVIDADRHFTEIENGIEVRQLKELFARKDREWNYPLQY